MATNFGSTIKNIYGSLVGNTKPVPPPGPPWAIPGAGTTVASTIPGTLTINTGQAMTSMVTSAVASGSFLTAAGGANGPSWIGGNATAGTFNPTPNPNVIVLSGGNGNKEIVKLTREGEVIWANGIDVNAAAEAFGRSLNLSAEMRAGITDRVRHSIRDTIFGEIINIAKEKGSLTADELTLMLEASKIMEKLKGI